MRCPLHSPGVFIIARKPKKFSRHFLSETSGVFSKHQDLVSDHFGNITLVAVLVFPGAAYQLPLNGGLLAFGKDLFCNFSSFAPGNNIVPLCLLGLLSVTIAVLFVGRKRKTSHAAVVTKAFHFWVVA
jgi:hypothetical protein